VTYKKRDQFGPELAYFSKCILNNEEPEPNGLEGLADVCVINAIQESAEKDQPIAIKPIEKSTPDNGAGIAQAHCGTNSARLCAITLAIVRTAQLILLHGRIPSSR